MSEDACDSLGKDDSLVGYNQYAYCKNNPIRMYDPTGRWGWDWDTFWDVAVTAVTAVASVAVGIAVGAAVAATAPFTVPLAIAAGVTAGLATGIGTNGVVNNAVNAVYYEFSDGESSIDGESYQDTYLNRWERLDYAKQQTGEEHYSMNVWRYHSEYSVHMYGWFALRGQEGKGTLLGDYANSLKSADVDPVMWDNRPVVKLGTICVGILGW